MGRGGLLNSKNLVHILRLFNSNIFKTGTTASILIDTYIQRSYSPESENFGDFQQILD